MRPGRSRSAFCALALLAIAAPSGCDPSETAIVTKVICPTIQKYDKATQDRALAELRALPPGSALREFVGDYKQLRDRIETCRQRGQSVQKS